MTNDNRTDEQTELAALISKRGVAGTAELLGVNSAHVSNAHSGKRKISPTLRRAMIRAGLIPKPDPYPYFKIRRDDPKRAAEQIRDNLGIDFAGLLVAELVRLSAVNTIALASKLTTPEKPKRRVPIIGFANPTIVPATDTKNEGKS